MKKRLYGIVVLAAMLLIVPVFGFCEWNDVVNNMANGSVNWSEGVIQAKGIGAPPEELYGKPQARPMALRAAQLDAYRNLLEITKGVRVNSTTLVRNYVTENDVIMTKVEGLVKGAQIVDREYMSDGTVEVTVQMNLHGGFAQVVLPSNIKDVEPVTPVEEPGDKMPDTPEEPWTPGEPEADKPETRDAVYTGLVVDARGLNAKPAMAPKILDESEREVYGSAFVSREFAIQQGMTGYSKQLEAAKTNERVTDNPIVVKALDTQGPGKCDIVISNADAAKLRSASENLSFLKKCKVMIVVD
ncbi:MAG: LPP20 family lipoprotein [Thermodesulfobacteriota bacterium]|nr:LPP20 family lipoprotein [Thermodesulfobacteriota bacterium]